jgi:exopolysaccharide production protein ExoZ
VTPAAPADRLVLVQVLRAVAALAVAMLHAQHDAGALAARLGTSIAPIAFPWAAGVDIFFVISGFVMVHASRDLFGRPGASRIFLARRIARIAPIYWAVTTLYLALAFAAPALLNSEVLDPVFVLASYLFFPMNRPDGTPQPLYSLGWTLNYEMAFYALFALAIPFARTRAVAGLIVALCAIAALGHVLAPPMPFAFWANPIIVEFAFGLALGLARAEGLRLNGGARLALLAAGVALLAADFSRNEALITLPRFLAHGFPGALIVAAAALGDGGGGSGRLVRWGEALGDSSYALYLVHPFAIRAGREIVWRSGLAPLIGPWGYVVLCLVVATVAALAVHVLFERPVTRAARRLAGV